MKATLALIVVLLAANLWFSYMNAWQVGDMKFCLGTTMGETRQAFYDCLQLIER